MRSVEWESAYLWKWQSAERAAAYGQALRTAQFASRSRLGGRRAAARRLEIQRPASRRTRQPPPAERARLQGRAVFREVCERSNHPRPSHFPSRACNGMYLVRIRIYWILSALVRIRLWRDSQLWRKSRVWRIEILKIPLILILTKTPPNLTPPLAPPPHAGRRRDTSFSPADPTPRGGIPAPRLLAAGRRTRPGRTT